MSIVNYGFGQGISYIVTYGFGLYEEIVTPRVDVELVCRILTSMNFTVSLETNIGNTLSIETSFDNVVDMSN